MAVTIKVNGTSNSLVHKGSNGISMATVPDVCKTPSPAGPVPLPYPNISQSANLEDGTTTVKGDGGNMIATKGSKFGLSNGDNAGVAGGVKSSTFMKESTWILYSFDVKFDGSNACRLTDKKLQNHENTADMGGVVQLPTIVGDNAEELVACAVHCCDEAATYTQSPRPLAKHAALDVDCQRLNSKKHSCVMHSLRNQGSADIKASPRVPGSDPSLSIPQSVLDSCGKGFVTPDAMVNAGKKWRVIDAKFPCPPTNASKGRIVLNDQAWPCKSSALGDTMRTPKEDKVYPEIEVNGAKVDSNVDAMTPADAKSKKNAKCDCKPLYKHKA
jgi:Domain of unknown function (DUF4150)